MRIFQKPTLAASCAFITLFSAVQVYAERGDIPERNGITFELSYGYGSWQIVPYDGENRYESYPAFVAYSIGFFLNNKFSLLVRASQMFLFVTEFKREPFLHIFAGANFQYWISDRIFVGGGPGFAIEGTDNPNGFAFNYRVGFSFANWKDHSLRIGAELFTRFFANYVTLGEAVVFEWQWF